MADNTRMADKLRNAFSIELLTLAQTEVENRNALPLVPVSIPAADSAQDTTYEQKRDAENKIAKVLIVVLAALAIFFAVFR